MPPATKVADSATTGSLRTDVGKRIEEHVRALVPLLRKEAPEVERLGGLTPDVLESLNSAGAFRLQLPVELGGSALGVRDTTEIIAEIARGDASPAWIAVVSGGVTGALAFPQQAIDEVFGLANSWSGPIAFGGSVLATGAGTARKVDGGWQISGQWPFSSGCLHTAWGFVICGYEDDAGQPRKGMFILSHDQVVILDDWRVMGLQGTSSNSVTVIGGEAFVPDHRFVDMADVFGTIERNRVNYEGIAFNYLPLGVVVPLSFGSIALGMARGATESFVELAQNRKPFNMPYVKISDMASAQVTAGRTRAMVNMASAIIRQRADEADMRALSHQPYEPAESAELTMDVVHAINLCAEAIDLMQLTVGSSTAGLNNPIQRYVRDMRVLSMHGALRFDPNAEISGRHMFRLPPFVPFADIAAPGGAPGGVPSGPPPGFPPGRPPGFSDARPAIPGAR